MTPTLFILSGLALIGVTIWDIRREEADMLFWMDSPWWNVNKRDHPLFYRIAVVSQFLVALLMITVGVVWLIGLR